MPAYDVQELIQELTSGDEPMADRVQFIERCLVEAANESRRRENAALDAGTVADMLREQDARRNLLHYLDRAREFPGAVGYPTSAELVVFRIGTPGADLFADARTEELTLGIEYRLGPKARRSPL